MKILGDIPGLPGVFVAGIFSAALRQVEHVKISPNLQNISFRS